VGLAQTDFRVITANWFAQQPGRRFLENWRVKMTIQFSRRLAILGGILAPLAETIRRWSTWQQAPANLFDDYIMGAFLLYGAWRTGKNLRNGQRVLAAAWAFACGFGYSSFFGQLHNLRLGERDPAPISSEWVLVIKGIAFTLAIIALVVSLKPLSEEAPLIDS
jgi:hypothetical protein